MPTSNPENSEAKLLEAVREVLRMSELAMAPLAEPGEIEDRNKLVIITTLLFLMTADFIDPGKLPYYEFIRPEYLALALAVVGLYYCLVFVAACWRGWHRRRARNALIDLTTQSLSAIYSTEREQLLSKVFAEHSKAMGAIEAHKATFKSFKVFEDKLEVALAGAMEHWRSGLSAEVQAQMRETAYPFKITGYGSLRAELVKAVKAAIDSIDFLDGDQRRALLDVLLRKIENETDNSKRTLSLAEINYAAFNFLRSRLSDEQMENAVAKANAEVNGIRRQFEGIIQLLGYVNESLVFRSRSFALRFWGDLVLPLALFVFVFLASLDNIRPAATKAWQQLLPAFASPLSPWQV